MLNYNHKKERHDLDKSIDKKQENAEKLYNKVIKDRVKGTKKMMERLEVMKQTRERE